MTVASSYRLEVAVEEQTGDGGWDDFVQRAAGGQHGQTERWAAGKSGLGWSSARVVLRSDGEIAAGCQVLLRKLAPLTTIGYAPRGPLPGDADPETLERLIAGLDDLSRRAGVRYLKVQPPPGAEAAEPLL